MYARVCRRGLDGAGGFGGGGGGQFVSRNQVGKSRQIERMTKTALGQEIMVWNLVRTSVHLTGTNLPWTKETCRSARH